MDTLQLDENLIIRMAGGDKSAFSELYLQTQSAVYGFALSIMGNKHDAEDVMHDAYIKTYWAAISYKPMGSPMAWLLTIVRNLCYTRLKSGRVCEDVSEYENFVSDPSAGDSAGDIEDREVLEKAMKILDHDERQIVILHALTGLKHREIAELLEIPTGTVLSKYNRALKKMRKSIETEG